MEQFMAPWQVAQSFGSYLNPLAGALQNRSESEDLTAAYLLQGLGPILSAGGSAAGRWLFGTPAQPGQNGQPGTPATPGVIGEFLKKFKIPGLG
jgi:hypothetical protein